jgi:hypothetical protein
MRSHVVIVFVLNQSSNNWLLSNALQFAITMCLKFREKIKNPFAPINLIGDDFKLFFELFLFTSNIRRGVCGVLDYFLFFQKIYEEKKSHNMFFMLYLKAFV